MIKEKVVHTEIIPYIRSHPFKLSNWKQNDIIHDIYDEAKKRAINSAVIWTNLNAEREYVIRQNRRLQYLKQQLKGCMTAAAKAAKEDGLAAFMRGRLKSA